MLMLPEEEIIPEGDFEPVTLSNWSVQIAPTPQKRWRKKISKQPPSKAA